MNLTPEIRLKAHLILYYPNVRMTTVSLSATPGYIITGSAVINIRGAGYAPGNAPLRLWNELHAYYSSHVEIVREKNKQPTIIAWNGMVYTLDQKRSHRR